MIIKWKNLWVLVHFFLPHRKWILFTHSLTLTPCHFCNKQDSVICAPSVEFRTQLSLMGKESREIRNCFLCSVGLKIVNFSKIENYRVEPGTKWNSSNKNVLQKNAKSRLYCGCVLFISLWFCGSLIVLRNFDNKEFQWCCVSVSHCFVHFVRGKCIFRTQRDIRRRSRPIHSIEQEKIVFVYKRMRTRL